MNSHARAPCILLTQLSVQTCRDSPPTTTLPYFLSTAPSHNPARRTAPAHSQAHSRIAQGDFVVGRNPKSCNLVLDSTEVPNMVSRRRASEPPVTNALVASLGDSVCGSKRA